MMDMVKVPQPAALMNRETEGLPAGPALAGKQQRWRPLPRADLVDRAVELDRWYAPVALRMALALGFVWFGVLKLAGVSPVGELLAATFPFVDPDLLVPVLGAVEVVMGVALAIGRLPRLVPPR
jgi:putative oxidoreductase